MKAKNQIERRLEKTRYERWKIKKSRSESEGNKKKYKKGTMKITNEKHV